MAPSGSIWHKESLKLKEIFGTREGFEICPNNFSPRPKISPPGTVVPLRGGGGGLDQEKKGRPVLDRCCRRKAGNALIAFASHTNGEAPATGCHSQGPWPSAAPSPTKGPPHRAVPLPLSPTPTPSGGGGGEGARGPQRLHCGMGGGGGGCAQGRRGTEADPRPTHTSSSEKGHGPVADVPRGLAPGPRTRRHKARPPPSPPTLRAGVGPFGGTVPRACPLGALSSGPSASRPAPLSRGCRACGHCAVTGAKAGRGGQRGTPSSPIGTPHAHPGPPPARCPPGWPPSDCRRAPWRPNTRCCCPGSVPAEEQHHPPRPWKVYGCGGVGGIALQFRSPTRPPLPHPTAPTQPLTLGPYPSPPKTTPGRKT